METSILNSTKKRLGMASDYTAFDEDVITQINSAFSDLTQLGVGPAVFVIEDESADWTDYIADDDVQLSWVKTFIYLKVRLAFDPPQTSYLISAMEKQIEQLEFRLSVDREGKEWVDPNPPIVEEVP
jgi:hypothetical protein